MGQVIPIEMGLLDPHVMRMTLRVYDEVIDIVEAVGTVTTTIRHDVAMVLVEMPAEGVQDTGLLKREALQRATEIEPALRQVLARALIARRRFGLGN